MKRSLRSVVVVVAAAAAVFGVSGSASAAVTTIGYDVSYPQCGGAPLPYSHAFGVVGVNGGVATTDNPCMAAQLTWAWKSSGAVRMQPRAQLYVNTANPGEYIGSITTWPTTGSTPYGTCTGANSAACSWQYGWQRASDDVGRLTYAAMIARVDGRASSYTWWLDVENANTWQSGSTTVSPATAQTFNRATLEGMTAYLTAAGGRVGLYSTSAQWNPIVGAVPTTSNLAWRASWLPGATTLSGAIANCAKPALTPGGRVTLTQFVANGLDRDHSCG
jgi:hypothetical protein